MMPGNPCHKDADFPYPKLPKQERPHKINYCKFLFGKKAKEKDCKLCGYESCTGYIQK
jgi:hypothetical protein